MSGKPGEKNDPWEKQDPRERDLPWWQQVIIGVGASFIIPLFLNSISANLIERIMGTDGKPADAAKLLVLAGFCLLAAIASRSFIQTLSDRVLRLAKNANVVADDAKRLARAATEEASKLEGQSQLHQEALVEAGYIRKTIPDDTQDAETYREPPPMLTTEKRRVLGGMLKRPNLAMRSINGIATDAKLDPASVELGLQSLVTNGLVEQGQNAAGRTLYYVTLSGQRAFGIRPGSITPEQPMVP